MLPAPIIAFGLVKGKCDSDPSCHRVPHSLGNDFRLVLQSVRRTTSTLSKPPTLHQNHRHSPSSSLTCAQTCSTSAASVLGPRGVSFDWNCEQIGRLPSTVSVNLILHHIFHNSPVQLTFMCVEMIGIRRELLILLFSLYYLFSEMMTLLLCLLEESQTAQPVSQELINFKMIVLRSQMEDVRKNLNVSEWMWMGGNWVWFLSRTGDVNSL